MRDLQQELEFAVNASDLGIFHCPMPLGKIVWNERCKDHFWLPHDADVDIELFYSLIHPQDRERTRAAVEACVQGGQPYDIEYRVVSPTGEIRWLRASGHTYRDSAGRPRRFDGTTLDITERKRAEVELRETRDRFQAMANSIPQLAWMAMPDGGIFWYNQRWHDYRGAGGNPDDWDWSRLQDPAHAPRVNEKSRAALASGEPWEDTFPLKRHDGEYRWHLSRALPFRDSDGNVLLWFGTHTDVTEERRQAENRQQLLETEQAARREAERVSRMKDEFLATLSHELRTPLNAIFGWTQLLKLGPIDAETVSQAVAVIDRNVRAQTQLIDDLLDMSRVISGKVRLDIQTIELGQVIDAAIEVVQPAIAAKHIRFERMVDPELGAVSGDASRLQQVLWNLLTNAAKFTPEGGLIRLVAQRRQGRAEVAVSDSGIGIDPDFLPHMFERFRQADASTTRQHGGLGLGLSIVKSLVELHGGTIEAASAGLNQGATFRIRFPVHRAALAEQESALPRAANPEPRVPRELPRLDGVKVLIIDDEADAREVVKRFLIDCHAIPAVAASAAEAESLVESFAPDVILSDIGMPGQDGYEFIRNVRRRGLQTPAIALTAFARSDDRLRSFEAGYQAHLAKPVEPAQLLATVAQLHADRAPRDSQATGGRS